MPHSVLVVDDDPSIRDAVGRALRLDGYDVGLAADGLDALHGIETSDHDAVVLDIGLPQVDGLALCRRLRMERRRVPILLLTARDAVADRVAGVGSALAVGAGAGLYPALRAARLTPTEALRAG